MSEPSEVEPPGARTTGADPADSPVENSCDSSDGDSCDGEPPLGRSLDPAPEPARIFPEASLDGRRRVLVIEDNDDAAEGMRDVIELDEHVVEVAHDGPAGLALARVFEPDVVLCDIGLPEMDGYAVARAFRADEALRSIHLVALSGYTRPADVARAKEAGFDRHLAKPPSMDQINEAIASAPRREPRAGR